MFREQIEPFVQQVTTSLRHTLSLTAGHWQDDDGTLSETRV
jgi:hypothetical protein